MARNDQYLADVPWPPPPAVDPFNFVGSSSPPPFNFFSAGGQWEMLKELGRQEVQNKAQLSGSSHCRPDVSTPVPGCTSFSNPNEPNHRAGRPSMMSEPLRHGIDYPQALSQSPLGELCREALILEEDMPCMPFSLED